MELSIIIPCKNEAATLRLQLDALARQAWDAEWEVILVDNGSTDDSARLALEHEGLSGRLRVVHAPDETTIAGVRRRGVEASNARAIAFCDGDDVVGDRWVAALGSALRTHDFVTGQIEVDLLNPPGLAASRGRKRLGQAAQFGAYPLLNGNTCGMTRAAWDRFNGFDESFRGLEDIEMSLRLAAAGEHIEYVPDAILHYRYRSGARAIWKQGQFYGASQVALARRCRSLGLQPPKGHAWKSWLWLVASAARMWRRDRRLGWLWVLACRVGAVRADVRYRIRRLGFLLLLAWARRRVRSTGPHHRAPLHLIVVAFNRPALIRTQLAAFREWLDDEYSVTVADNSSSQTAADDIRRVCAEFGAEYIRLRRNPYTGHDPSRSHAEALRLASRSLRRLNDAEVIGFLDHDVFPTQGTSVLPAMEQHDAYGPRHARAGQWYLWPGLLFLRPATLDPKTLQFGLEAGGDTGSALYFSHLRHLPADRIGFFSSGQDSVVLDGRSITFERHGTWVHLGNGSDWRGTGSRDDDAAELLRHLGVIN